jgi:hypothetical protein
MIRDAAEQDGLVEFEHFQRLFRMRWPRRQADSPEPFTADERDRILARLKADAERRDATPYIAELRRV